MRLGNKRYEDFEFTLKSYQDSFYVKTVSYLDFFKKDYVVAIKSIKLHNSPSYDELNRAYAAQNIYIDDFFSSKTLFPNFAPQILALLNDSVLEGKFRKLGIEDELRCVADAEDGYVSQFYSILFARMKQDVIMENFVKARVNFDLWFDMAKKLRVPQELIKSMEYYSDAGVPKYFDTISKEISPEDRKGFNDLLFIVICGVKSEVLVLILLHSFDLGR